MIPPSLRRILETRIDILSVSPWLFWGKAGSGKTCAAVEIYKRWGGMRAFWDAQKTMSAFFEHEYTIRKTLEDADLIVLDDVAARSPTNPQLDALRMILEWRRGKPLLITSNLGPDALDTVLDDRCASRICAGWCHEFKDADRRLLGAIIT